jgi:hypothetical protein
LDQDVQWQRIHSMAGMPIASYSPLPFGPWRSRQGSVPFCMATPSSRHPRCPISIPETWPHLGRVLDPSAMSFVHGRHPGRIRDVRTDHQENRRNFNKRALSDPTTSQRMVALEDRLHQRDFHRVAAVRIWRSPGDSFGCLAYDDGRPPLVPEVSPPDKGSMTIFGLE